MNAPQSLGSGEGATGSKTPRSRCLLQRGWNSNADTLYLLPETCGETGNKSATNKKNVTKSNEKSPRKVATLWRGAEFLTGPADASLLPSSSRGNRSSTAQPTPLSARFSVTHAAAPGGSRSLRVVAVQPNLPPPSPIQIQPSVSLTRGFRLQQLHSTQR